MRGRTRYEQQTLRLFGIPESEIAETLRVAEREVEGFDALEITTCLRRAEVEMVGEMPDDLASGSGAADAAATLCASTAHGASTCHITSRSRTGKLKQRGICRRRGKRTRRD